ncbi:hypothetical protein [Tardiphaga sp. 619_E2_N8_5]|uniref:hypothetical protein n=1 Tax=unclassified Tardiphaga TaxID=2631404 RepID=UPI003F21D649
MHRNKIEDALNNLVEILAAKEHERWSHWQKYMHSHGIKQTDGSVLMPADLVARWEQQMSTEYCCLTEQEKESDRDQVRKYLPVIADAISKASD